MGLTFTPPVDDTFEPSMATSLLLNAKGNDVLIPVPKVHANITLPELPTNDIGDMPSHQELGKNNRIGLMWPRTYALDHPAAELLEYYSRHGCPVDCGEPWTREHIMAAIKRGNHPTACDPEARKYLLQESKEREKGGYAKIVRLGDILNDIPENFKLSPLAMIAHKSRLFRCILDLSFRIYFQRHQGPSVNHSTTLLAPQKAMAQLGSCIQRIIATLAAHYNLKYPFMFCKLDIKDGYWRMVVSDKDAWHFCYMITPEPSTPIEDILIVVPHSLQMGWRESPPYFCAATETARDVIQNMFVTLPPLPHHPLEEKMYASTTVPNVIPPPELQTEFIEVYVDDFCAGTNVLTNSHLQQLSRAMLHGIHSVFPPPSISGHDGHDPVSIKKLDEGEGVWSFTKELLGWTFSGNTFTMQLSQEKIKTIIELIKDASKQNSITLKQFQKIAGKLQHASYGIPGGRGFFSPIWRAFTQANEMVTLTAPLKQALQDWTTILQCIGKRPTSILELTPKKPDFIGYVDASGFGAGGVWFSGESKLIPTVWRITWPKEIQARLVSFTNPRGTITNSDLEMAGHLLHWLILELIAPISLKHKCAGIFSDNTPTVSWAYKLSSTKSIVAGHLLRALAVRLHVHQASPLLTTHVAGEDNTMADSASRSSKLPVFKNSNKPFIITFNTLFPLPQNISWSEFHVPSKTLSLVTSCLLGKQLSLASWMKIHGQGKNIGLTGVDIQKVSTSILSSKDTPKCTATSSSQPSLLGSGQAVSAEVVKSKFNRLLKPLVQLARPSSWLDNAPRSTKHRKLTPSQWDGSLKDSDDKTPPPSHK